MWGYLRRTRSHTLQFPNGHLEDRIYTKFDHHLFFNKDSKNPLPSSCIASNAHPIMEQVCFACSSFLSCLSCLSMFPMQQTGLAEHSPCSRRTVVSHSYDPPRRGGGGPACLKPIEGVIHPGHEVTPRAQDCRSIWAPLVVEEGLSVFWSIRVYSCPFVVRLH